MSKQKLDSAASEGVPTVLDKKWKVSSYRPFGIIARDPNESTYEVGDDKFPILIDVRGSFKEQQALANRIVTDHNYELVRVSPSVDEAAVRRAAEKIIEFAISDRACHKADECDWYCKHRETDIAEIISTELASDSGKVEK